MRTRSCAIALGFAGTLALGALSASAGPLPTATAGVKAVASDHVTDVRWRGRGIGPGIAFGLAAGALVGAAVAAQPYYAPGYYYNGPVYAEPYAYQPVYPAPGYHGYRDGYRYGYGECYTDEGYGRVRPCSSR